MLVFKCPKCQNKFTMSDEQFGSVRHAISCPSCRYRYNDYAIEHLRDFMQSEGYSEIYLLPNDTEITFKPNI